MRSSTTPSAPIVYCGHTFSISPSLIPLPPFIPILTVTNSPFIILSSLLDLLFSSFLTLYILFVLLFNPVPWKYYIKSNLKGVSFSTWENLSRAKSFCCPSEIFDTQSASSGVLVNDPIVKCTLLLIVLIALFLLFCGRPLTKNMKIHPQMSEQQED